MVSPATMPGSASGSSTFQTICQVLAPMDCAASTRPPSTSRRAVSTRRAMKGAAASVSGTTAAQVPMDVPVTRRVNGMMATSRMMKGVERTALTMPPTTLLSGAFCRMPPLSVRRRNTPSGMPTRPPMMPEAPTMITVSHSEMANSSSIISEKFSNTTRSLFTHVHGAHHHAVGAQIVDGRADARHGAAGVHGQRAEGLLLDLVDLAMQDGQVQPQLADQVRQNGLVGMLARIRQAQQLAARARRQARRQAAHAREHAGGQLLRHDLVDQALGDVLARAREHLDHRSEERRVGKECR